MKKIAIITSFAEYHLLKFLIPNIITVIDPDKIYISEGLIKSGPENKGFQNLYEFNQKWTYQGEGRVGFDWEETKSLEKDFENLVTVRDMDYDINDSPIDCYIKSITVDDFEFGDEIYCFESDSFLLESDKDLIYQEVQKLNIGDGMSAKFVDFLETQYYTENINLYYPKFRRFVYKFDNLQNYQRKMGGGFLTQNYSELNKVESFFMRHYCWWRPNEYKQLRYDLIYRSDPQYWKDFENGLQQIRINSDYQLRLLAHRQKMSDPEYQKLLQTDIMRYATIPRPPDNKILIRPSRQDEGRWAKFIDIEHPTAIKSHPNFVK